MEAMNLLDRMACKPGAVGPWTEAVCIQLKSSSRWVVRVRVAYRLAWVEFCESEAEARELVGFLTVGSPGE